MTSIFDKQKVEKLKKVDLSRKGSVDERLVDFLSKLNNHQDFFSLSSCSGRIIIFVGGEQIKKQGCQWVNCIFYLDISILSIIQRRDISFKTYHYITHHTYYVSAGVGGASMYLKF